ncbi:NUDIX hydrolase [Propioniciclava soli]|uniref:NUDIX hydrolase n=1 Tax=Propioniciclava soli TaxID=2775081 RepID=UPI001E637AF8|nr:8-oxo-dGTP diphosphatase [Propioniciclava soli]
MPYAPVLTTLAYVVRGEEVLLVHRTFREDDAAHGKFNGLGGKVEPDEDVVAGLRRELREEAGLEVTSWVLRGTVSFPGLGAGEESELAMVFVVDGFAGEPPPSNEEGPLHWVPRDRLGELPMWEGDLFWLPHVFDPTVGQFHGVLPYRDGHPTGWSVSIQPAGTG